ncbi:sugar ABC transporter permease [Candidatus Aerophobetes bacterium]|nr:sugar ABC transporter permease [Candidatus Aerophobetes bacterium]
MICRKEEKPLAYLLILPATIILGVLTLYPFGFMIYLSVHRWKASLSYIPKSFVGLSHFVRLFQDEFFWSAMSVTFRFLVFVVLIEFFLGLFLALILSREIKGRNLIRSLFLLPMMLAPVVVGLIWRFILNDEVGILNYFFSLIHLPPQSWLGDVNTALGAIMLVDVWQWTPFMILVLLAGLQSLPDEPFEAAKIDGASAWQTFKFITIPLLKPAILIALLFRTIDAYRIFDIIYVMTYGGPKTSTETLSLYVYRNGFRHYDMGYTAALSLVMLVIIIAISQGYIKFMVKE